MRKLWIKIELILIKLKLLFEFGYVSKPYYDKKQE